MSPEETQAIETAELPAVEVSAEAAAAPQAAPALDVSEDWGLVSTEQIPQLLAAFGIEGVQPDSFPWSHRFAPAGGREREVFAKKQSEVRMLQIGARGAYSDERGPVDAHRWQLVAEAL